MADSSFSQTNMGIAHKPIKLRDLGDDTYAITHMEIGHWEKLRIAGAGTTVVKNSLGTLHGILVGNAIALSSITVYDNTAGSGTIALKITHPLTLAANQYFLPINCKMDVGITVVTSAGDDITILYI